MDGNLAIYDVKTGQTKQIFEEWKLPVRFLHLHLPGTF